MKIAKEEILLYELNKLIEKEKIRKHISMKKWYSLSDQYNAILKSRQSMHSFQLNKNRKGRMVTFLFALLIATLAVSSSNAQLLTEPFNYTASATGGLQGQSSGAWQNINSGDSILVESGSLSYTGLAASTGNKITYGGTGTDAYRAFTSQTTGTVYASFLLNITSLGSLNATGGYTIGLLDNGTTNFGSTVWLRLSGTSNFNIGVNPRTTAANTVWLPTAYSTSTTYLVVIAYQIVSGTTNDVVKIWVNPTSLAGTEPTADGTATNALADLASIQRIFLRQDAAAATPGVITIDEMRVGTTWASVTPAGGVAPTTQVSAINFSNATATSTDVNWTNGNGSGRIVKANTVNTFTNPADGSLPSANATYGSGEQVIYAGTGSTVNVGGLVAGQTYYFRAYEYNSTGVVFNTTTTTGNPNSTTINYPTPTLTSISPSSASAGGSSFTITATGSSFYSNSVIKWNGSALTTTFVNSTTLTASVPAGNIATAGTAAVTVVNTTPGGGASAAQTFTINASVSPTIAVTSSFTSFTGEASVASASQSYTVAGSNLTSDITISTASPFQVSTDNSSWSTSVTLIQSSGSVAASTVYVRLLASTSGSYSGTLSHSTVGTSNVDISISGSAIAATPSVQSSITLTAATANSLSFSLNGGNGAGRILVASTTPITYSPIDAVASTGVNADFSLATNQGSGNKIVFDGSGTSVTVTGLAAATTYYFAVYEYNGSGITTNYYQATPGTASAATIAAEPTTSSTIVYTRMTADTAYVSFVGGNGANRLAVINNGAAVSFVPVDGTTYSGANTNLSLATDQGSGNKIVYIGSATSAKITGFPLGSTLNIAVYEYNGTGSAINYRATPGTTTGTSPAYIPYVSGNYFQDFNTLPSTATTYTTGGFGQAGYHISSAPFNFTGATGWQIAAISGSASADVKLTTDNGSSTSGSAFNYGSTSSTDRAFGCLASGSYLGAIGAVLVNNSTEPLTKVTVTYMGENWRRGGSGNPNQLLFAYKVGANSINASGFTTVPSLNFTTPSPVSGAAAIDGNNATNRSLVTATFNLDNNWMPGQTLTIRWLDVDENGSDDGLAIDSLTFVAVGATTPVAQDSMISFSNVLTTSMDVNWLNGDATTRIVVMNTSNSFTNPVDGTDYTANSLYAGSGQQVVYNGSGSTVNVTGLNPSTTYYFQVFAFNGAGTATKYNTSTAASNPNSQITAAPQVPTKLVITSLNGGSPILENTPFTLTIQARDDNNSAQNVTANTTVTLTVFSGAGSLTATVSGVILAGTNTVTITGIVYDIADFGVQLEADATAGDVLNFDVSASFEVLGVATQLSFVNVGAGAAINTTISAFQVHALRSDNNLDPYYTGNATISVVSGPSGSITGTLSQPFVNGIATFTGIQFTTPGSYILDANAGTLTPGYSSAITITAPVTMTELVVPKYMGAKTAATANNARTPLAICIQLDNLLPNTTYNIAAGMGLTSETTLTLGAGGIWNGTAFTQTISNAFTSDGNGSSGPYWMYFQPTGNGTRFDAGNVHNLRVAYSSSALSGTSVPNFISTKTITTLDIGTTERTIGVATDDGAFLLGSLNACMSGKNILVYDNETGTGDPLYAYPSVNLNGTQTAQSELPDGLDSVYANTAAPGSFAAIIPIGANNPNGVRRVEARNAANVVVNAASDADGIWGSGANTTTVTRRSLTRLTNTDASLTTLTALSVTRTDATCYNAANGSAIAVATTSASPSTYSWSAGSTSDTQSSLAAGTYTVTATDANGCVLTSTVTINQPASNNPIASNGGATCIGTDATLSVSNGTSWSWTGPHGFTSSAQNPTVSTSAYTLAEAGAHTYTVVITYANGCTETATTSLVLLDCSCTPPTLSATQSNVSCFGANNGSINLTITGGVAPYSIAWSNGATTEDISGLAPGTYKAVVTENGGCKDSITITITQPAAALASSFTSVNATCFGSTNGSVNLTVSGGTTPYTYLWSNSANSEDLTGIGAGTYNVTITDANGCTASNTVTVTQPAAITITTNTVTNPLCNGALTGAIDISSSADAAGNASNDPGLLISEFMADPTGGDNSNEWVELIATRSIDFSVTPFSVVFANNGTATVNGWKAGAALTYGFNINTGTVQRGDVVYVGGSLMGPSGTKLRVISTGTVAGDAFGNLNATGVLGNGGTSADAVGVFNVAAASITTSTAPVDAIFFGTALGGAVVSAGAAGYTLPTNDKYSGGLLQSTSYFIPSSPTQGKSFLATGTYNYQTGVYTTPRTWTVDPTSFSNATSTVSLVNSVSYAWSNGATTQDLSGVAAGTYTVTVTNASGCTASTSIAVTQPTALSITATPGTIACNGGTTTVSLNATGGTGAYTFGGASTTVSAGTYNYTVTDANACSASASITVSQPTALSITATPGTIACNGGTTTVSLSATGGTGAYTFGGASTTVSAGTYNYTVTDANACSASTSITVSQPAAITITGFTPSSGSVGTTVVITGTELTNVSLVSFGAYSAAFTVNSNTQITATVPAGATTAAITVTTPAGCSATSATNFVVNSFLSLDVKMFIQGFYSGSGTMTPVLYNNGLSTDPTDVDSVTIELHDGSSPFAAAASINGLLKTDGHVQVQFSGSLIGTSYYIVVKHRNSIETWSASPVLMGATTTFDFTAP